MENQTNLDKILYKLETSKEPFIKVTKEMLESANGNLYPLDLFVLGIVKRSILLTSGFCSLIRQNNFLSSAPIVRLHLDNLLNLHASFIAPDPHEFSMSKLRGERTSKLKDKTGQFMTDTYLAESLSKEKETEWVINLYRESSKFIHVSDKHIFSTVEELKKDGQMSFVISDQQNIPQKSIIEATEAMVSISEQIFRHLFGWIQAKNNKS